MKVDQLPKGVSVMETHAVICVERMVNGKVKWLPLADQWTYREWYGCFSLLKQEDQ